jgi:hypothetical protein
MELPYRNSTTESEDQNSPIFASSVLPQLLANTPEIIALASPAKTSPFASTITTLIDRTRQRTQHADGHNEKNSSLTRSSLKSINTPADETIAAEDDKDYRVTVV